MISFEVREPSNIYLFLDKRYTWLCKGLSPAETNYSYNKFNGFIDPTVFSPCGPTMLVEWNES